MASARSTIAELVETALADPSVTVIPFVRQTDVTAKTVMVGQTRVEPLPEAPLAMRLHTFELYALVPGTTPSESLEDDLDVFALDVIDALEGSAVPNEVVVVSAERAPIDAKHHGYIITITCPFTKA